MVSSSTRLDGRWLTVARLLWAVMAVGYLALWLVSLPDYYERASTLTIEPFKLGDRPIYDNTLAQQEAEGRGLTLQTNALYNIGLSLIQVLVLYLVSLVILVRSANRYGVFTALVLMLFATNNMQSQVGVAAPFAGASLLIEIPAYIVWPLWMAWLTLFPNGRMAPQWAAWPFGVIIGLFLLIQVVALLGVAGFLSARFEAMLAVELSPVLVPPLFAGILGSHIYRYWRISTALERQQTKWLLLGVGLFFASAVAFALVGPVIHQITQTLFSLLFVFFPISVGMAILRYRLFDIDLLIRRTLQYSLLSGLLALVYFGLIVILQGLFTTVSGQSSSVAVVASTLAIAALFLPLRRRVQDFIDKRFFRQKYDAAQIISDFAATCRDETDLDKLTTRLVGVMRETMQPERATLWLKPMADSRHQFLERMRADEDRPSRVESWPRTEP